MWKALSQLGSRVQIIGGSAITLWSGEIAPLTEVHGFYADLYNSQFAEAVAAA